MRRLPPPRRRPAAAPDGGEPAVKPPVLTHFVPAVYPPDADAKGIAGSVTFSIVIDEKGAVGAVKVLDPGPHPGFAPAAEAAVKQFQFSPAVIGGKPTAVEIEYRYDFVLKRAPPPPPPTEKPVSLIGRVIERGTRSPVEAASVEAADATAETDADGRFTLARAAGRAGQGAHRLVRPSQPGHRRDHRGRQGERGRVPHEPQALRRLRVGGARRARTQGGRRPRGQRPGADHRPRDAGGRAEGDSGLPGRGARAVRPGPAHRSRLEPTGHRRLHGRGPDPPPVSLPGAHRRRQLRRHLGPRLLPRKLLPLLRQRDGRRGGDSHARSQARVARRRPRRPLRRRGDGRGAGGRRQLLRLGAPQLGRPGAEGGRAGRPHRRARLLRLPGQVRALAVGWSGIDLRLRIERRARHPRHQHRARDLVQQHRSSSSAWPPAGSAGSRATGATTPCCRSATTTSAPRR